MLSPVTARRRAARRRKTSPSDTDIPGADSDLTATAAVYGPLLPAAGAVTGKARIRAAPAVRACAERRRRSLHGQWSQSLPR